MVTSGSGFSGSGSLARLPLQVQVNGLARRLRLHGRSVRGGCAAFQHSARRCSQLRRWVVFTHGLWPALTSSSRWAEPACSRCCRRTVSPACCPGSRAPTTAARTGADGAVVLNLRRGPGAYALLSRADGQLTRAGQHYYSHLCLRPPARTSTTTSPSSKRGPTTATGRSSSLQGGEHRLTKLGKGFRDKYYKYLVHVPVIIRGRRRSGRNAGAGYERRTGERAGRGNEAPGAPHGGASSRTRLASQQPSTKPRSGSTPRAQRRPPGTGWAGEGAPERRWRALRCHKALRLQQLQKNLVRQAGQR